MNIAIIGSGGLVGSALVEHFTTQGHSVLCVDRNTELTLEKAARIADAVFIVTLPIENVASLFSRAVDVMRSGTLLIHGTSIENPAFPHDINTSHAVEKDITVCHCHFHFRPEIPLRRTLFGQNVSVSISGRDQGVWRNWLENELVPFQPLLHRLEPGEHDHITAVSQLMHMVVAFMIGTSWQQFPSQIVTKGINIGGPPCRLMVRSILRTASSGKVINGILLNHPLTLHLIAFFQESLKKLKDAIAEKNEASLGTILETVRNSIDPQNLEAWDASTKQLARLEADMRQTVATFHFTAEQNQIGLLEKVLHEFGNRGINMTSTIAQVTPDGGCIIMIGVKEDNPNVKEAMEAIKQLML
ncbi:MAG: hypothetical protein AAB547_00395 [Patescibacteria group bacterium]